MSPRTQSYLLHRWTAPTAIIGLYLVALAIISVTVGPRPLLALIGSPLVVAACVVCQLVADRLRKRLDGEQVGRTGDPSSPPVRR